MGDRNAFVMYRYMELENNIEMHKNVGLPADIGNKNVKLMLANGS